jgi:hypothetical protein
MEMIIIIKTGFWKTFEIINILKTIIITFTSYQMRWLNTNDNGFSP